MPSTSEKQAHFMSAAAHNPEFAKKAGIPQSVAEDFHEADKAKGKFKYSGGKKHAKDASPKETMSKLYGKK